MIHACNLVSLWRDGTRTLKAWFAPSGPLNLNTVSALPSLFVCSQLFSVFIYWAIFRAFVYTFKNTFDQHRMHESVMGIIFFLMVTTAFRTVQVQFSSLSAKFWKLTGFLTASPTCFECMDYKLDWTDLLAQCSHTICTDNIKLICTLNNGITKL
jgi:hypothetical protein